MVLARERERERRQCIVATNKSSPKVFEAVQQHTTSTQQSGGGVGVPHSMVAVLACEASRLQRPLHAPA